MIKLSNNKKDSFETIELSLKQLNQIQIKKFYESFIKRYNKLNKKFRFTESFNEDFIFDQLNKISKGKTLSFIPFGVKDIFNTKVLPTSMGSELWKGFKTGNDARVVSDILYNGGLVFSKTTTAEFAVHFISPNKTLNPHNINHITGTSSTGSAVAVACGALPICLGTQTAGSIIRPASYCGVYGFKPSFGAIDRTGVLKTNDTFDTIGLLSSDIYGIKKSFNSIYQKGSDYPNSLKIIDNYKKSKTKPRIGLFGNNMNFLAKFKDYVNNDFSNFIDLEKNNLNFSIMNNLEFLNDIHFIHETMYSKSLSYYFKQEIKSHEKVSDIMTEMIKRGEKITIDKYLEVAKLQPDICSKMDKIFEKYDFILVPSTASYAPKIGSKEITDSCLIWTFLGYPVLNLPIFYDETTKLPYGLQIIGKKFSDLSLLDFAENLEKKYKK
jgi:Asp-tRNA(Asn)/Glu-tRNA(Gln) amidotransferase A subunit family amidase